MSLLYYNIKNVLDNNRVATTWKTWKSPGISHWSGKSLGNCGLPVMCYRSSHKINITRVLLSKVDLCKMDYQWCHNILSGVHVGLSVYLW